MNHGIVDQQQLDSIELLMDQELIAMGVCCAMLIDTAGNTVAKRQASGHHYDTYAFAALAAAHFATVDSMAKIVGEREFSLLYHKGEKVSIYFSKGCEELLLITVFGKDLSLGLMRLKVCDILKRIGKIWNTLGNTAKVAGASA